MTSRPKDLPDFRKPPIAEAILSLQFEPTPGLTSAHLGLLWERFRPDLPQIEEHPPLPQVFERFGVPSAGELEVMIEEKPPVPRMWFVNENKTELVQIQSNRFIRNWRKLEGIEPYPHYEPIRERFRGEVAVFEKFLADEKLGSLVVNQCELTYVNHIEPSAVWTGHGQLEKVLTNWARLTKPSFLPNPEDAALHVRFIIPDNTGAPIGRLHAIAQPAWKRADSSPLLILNLTARGVPLEKGIEGAFAFLDLGREWIVKGFADLTTPEMHRVWERLDVQYDDLSQ